VCRKRIQTGLCFDQIKDPRGIHRPESQVAHQNRDGGSNFDIGREGNNSIHGKSNIFQSSRPPLPRRID
jgi:hypothetical protein